MTDVKKAAILDLLATAVATTAFAAEGPSPNGVPHLDHVFLIMMENHGCSQILNNPNAPNTNQVRLIGDTNYGIHGMHSAQRYTHFSLLKSLNAGFRLPCLNHVPATIVSA